MRRSNLFHRLWFLVFMILLLSAIICEQRAYSIPTVIDDALIKKLRPVKTSQTLDQSSTIDSTKGSTIAIQSSGGAITLQSNPQISPGSDGQIITIVGKSNTNTVTISSGNGVCARTSHTFTNNYSLQFLYDSSQACWVAQDETLLTTEDLAGANGQIATYQVGSGTPAAGIGNPGKIYLDPTTDPPTPYICFTKGGNCYSFGIYGDAFNQISNGSSSCSASLSTTLEIESDDFTSNLTCQPNPSTPLVKIKLIRTDVVNVKNYGAKGDGVTDDTAAINAAVSSANNVHVYLPPGTYKVSAPIKPTVSTNMFQLEGAGRELTKIVGNIANDGIVDEVGAFWGNTVIRNLSIENTSATGYCIAFFNSVGGTIEHVLCRAYRGLTNGNNGTWVVNDFVGLGADSNNNLIGMAPGGFCVSFQGNVTATGVDCTSFDTAVILNGTMSNLQGCRIENAHLGALLGTLSDGTPNQLSGSHLDACTFEANDEHIKVVNVSDSTLSNLEIHDTTNAPSGHTSKAVEFTGNFKSSKWYNTNIGGGDPATVANIYLDNTKSFANSSIENVTIQNTGPKWVESHSGTFPSALRMVNTDCPTSVCPYFAPTQNGAGASGTVVAFDTNSFITNYSVGSSGAMAFFSGAGQFGTDTNFGYDSTNHKLRIGQTSFSSTPTYLDIPKNNSQPGAIVGNLLLESITVLDMGILYHNAYYNGTNNVYRNNGTAEWITLYNDTLSFNVAPSGTAGNPVTPATITMNGTGSLTMASIAFASLGAPANGTEIYCSDCDTPASQGATCSSSGDKAGAWAKRIRGAWKCY